MYIAIVNFARTKSPIYCDDMRGFQISTLAVYNQAEKSDGLVGVARPQDDKEHLSFFEREWGDWGLFTLPSYYSGGRDAATIKEASALSVWRSIKDLRSFTYSGVHLRSIRQKDQWFESMTEPNYALWWTDSPIVTWKEGAVRLEYMLKHGTTYKAFTFRSLFDPEGNAISLSTCLERGL